MTNEEAAEKAIKEWPSNGYAKFQSGHVPQGHKPYQVGECRLFGKVGFGNNWEEAFQEALIGQTAVVDPQKT